MATEQTIKELQKRVDEAKKGLRSTMTVKELGKEHIKDIISEVSETQAYISKLFDREDDKLGTSSKALKNELEKLIEEGAEADTGRLREIQKRAASIAKVAREDGGEEGDYIGELADVLSGGAKKAGKLKLGQEIGVDDMIGSSVMKSIFGSKMTNWMWGGDGDGEAKGRQEAELRLLQAQANLDAAGGDGDGDDTTSSGAEQAEERREDEREEKIKAEKQDTILELLEEILFRVGGDKASSVDVTNSDRKSDASFGGPGGIDAGGGVVDEIADLLVTGAVLQTGATTTAWGGKWLLNKIPGINIGAQAAGVFPGFGPTSTQWTSPTLAAKGAGVGPKGVQLATAGKNAVPAATKMTSFTKANIITTMLASKAEFYIEQLERRSREDAAGLDWESGIDPETGDIISGREFGPQGGQWDRFTGLQVSRGFGHSDALDWRDHQLKLDNNEQHLLIRLKAATEKYENGTWHWPIFQTGNDEQANILLDKLQGDLWDRQKIVGQMRPQTMEEALELFSVSQETYNLFQSFGERLLSSVWANEHKDKDKIQDAIYAMSLASPDMKPEKFMSTLPEARGLHQVQSRRVLYESLGRFGFESDFFNATKGVEGGFLGAGKYRKSGVADWRRADYGADIREALGMDQTIDNDVKNPKSIDTINTIDSQQRQLNLPGPGEGHYGTAQPQAMLMQNHQNEFRNTVVAGQLLEDQNSIGIGNQARNNLYNEAMYSLI